MVFFREVRPGLVKINFRSKEKFDVQKIARVFGGGGHKKAAGALVKGDLKSICQKVIARVKRK
jgi:phosphoesterase RecJ-like protein